MRKLALAVAIIVASMLAPITLYAQPAPGSVECGPKKEVLATLEKRFNEVPYWEGEARSGYQVIVTQSPKGTWSWLMVIQDKDNPDESKTCLIDMGGDDGKPVVPSENINNQLRN